MSEENVGRAVSSRSVERRDPKAWLVSYPMMWQLTGRVSEGRSRESIAVMAEMRSWGESWSTFEDVQLEATASRRKAPKSWSRTPPTAGAPGIEAARERARVHIREWAYHGFGCSRSKPKPSKPPGCRSSCFGRKAAIRFAWKATLLALGSGGRAEDRRAGSGVRTAAPLRRMVENPDNRDSRGDAPQLPDRNH